jgi:hypothetical protein
LWTFLAGGNVQKSVASAVRVAMALDGFTELVLQQGIQGERAA